MMDTINFKDLSQGERQIWVDVFLHERERHIDDIKNIDKWLKIAEKKHGIIPRTIYVNKWIEVK